MKHLIKSSNLVEEPKPEEPTIKPVTLTLPTEPIPSTSDEQTEDQIVQNGATAQTATTSTSESETATTSVQPMEVPIPVANGETATNEFLHLEAQESVQFQVPAKKGRGRTPGSGRGRGRGGRTTKAAKTPTTHLVVVKEELKPFQEEKAPEELSQLPTAENIAPAKSEPAAEEEEPVFPAVPSLLTPTTSKKKLPLLSLSTEKPNDEQPTCRITRLSSADGK